LNPKFLYLFLDIAAFAVPFAFSFHPKASFVKRWKYYLPAIMITGIIFLLWDEYFTQKGYWGFNPDHTTGLYMGSLPIEEVLFFFCIPYACCFTYFTLGHFIQKNFLAKVHRGITIVLIIFSLIVAFTSFSKAYTSTTFFSLAALLILENYIFKNGYTARYYLAYLVLLIPFFIVNGILTGTFLSEPVVWYNDDENLGFRIGTIPLEDIFYGMLMILLSIAIAERLELMSIKKAPGEGSLNATK
jgi:lycopene cyclase domain-containing protein